MWRVGWLLLASCRLHFAERTTDASDDDATQPGFTALTAYGDDTCALYASSAYCWGANTTSQIGDVTTIDAVTPTRVQLPGPATAIAPGDSHGCAIVAGEPYCWGTLGGQVPFKFIVAAAPTTAIWSGNRFACLLADVVYCWGTNSVGQCGTGNMMTYTSPVPVMFTGSYFATQIDVGDDHACAHEPGLAPKCWGHNDDGTLGTGSFTPSQELNPVDVIGGVMALPRIAGWHACALEAGTVRCWGEGLMGELGDGLSTTSLTPVVVAGLSNVTAIETGGGPVDHDASCAIEDGTVYCWGRGTAGRLGTGSIANRPTPTPVIGLPARATSVALGYAHTCALLDDGDIWCWGRGDHGQLGDGNRASSLAPVKVTRPTM